MVEMGLEASYDANLAMLLSKFSNDEPEFFLFQQPR